MGESPRDVVVKVQDWDITLHKASSNSSRIFAFTFGHVLFYYFGSMEVSENRYVAQYEGVASPFKQEPLFIVSLNDSITLRPRDHLSSRILSHQKESESRNLASITGLHKNTELYFRLAWVRLTDEPSSTPLIWPRESGDFGNSGLSCFLFGSGVRVKISCYA